MAILSFQDFLSEDKEKSNVDSAEPEVQVAQEDSTTEDTKCSVCGCEECCCEKAKE